MLTHDERNAKYILDVLSNEFFTAFDKCASKIHISKSDLEVLFARGIPAKLEINGGTYYVITELLDDTVWIQYLVGNTGGSLFPSKLNDVAEFLAKHYSKPYVCFATGRIPFVKVAVKTGWTVQETVLRKHYAK